MNTFKKEVQICDVDIGDIKSFKGNKYPSLYIKLRLLTSEVDPSGQKYYPNGCTNIVSGTGNIKMDYEHNGYFAKQKGDLKLSQQISNAGEITKLEVEQENGYSALYGTARVGVEHKLMTLDGQVVGSSYASLWQLYAQKKVQADGGNIYDYIPDNIKTEFFDGQNVLPIKSISVEVPWKHYKSENYQDLNGLIHIKKFDLPRTAFLGFSSEGQPYSEIQGIEIKKINVATNSPPDGEAKKTTNPEAKKTMLPIKCLCEATIGQAVIKAGQVFEVLSSDNSNHKYEVKNAITDETITIITEEEAGKYEIAEEVVVADETSNEIKSVIKACMSCIENKKKMMLMQKQMNVKAETKVGQMPPATAPATTPSSNPAPTHPTPPATPPASEMTAMMNEMQVLKDELSSLTSRISGLEAVKAEVKTDEIAPVDVAPLDVAPVDVAPVDVIPEGEIVAEIKSASQRIESISFKTINTNNNIKGGFKVSQIN